MQLAQAAAAAEGAVRPLARTMLLQQLWAQLLSLVVLAPTRGAACPVGHSDVVVVGTPPLMLLP